MAFRSYLHHISCLTFQRPPEPKRSKDGASAAEDESISYVELRSTSAVLNKDSVVRIVLAGKMVEVYDTVIPACSVMEKYPGLCLAQPEVFKRPHDSLIAPKELLFPGQKFYLVPETTVKKLRQNKPRKLDGTKEVGVKKAVSDKLQERKCGGDMGEETVCSAKDFYISNDKWNLCSQRRFARREVKREEQKKRHFTPPIKKMKMRRCLLVGWKPSLPSVEELSP